MRLKNKVAIVTGAASGIGRAIADQFVKEGARVIYSDVVEPSKKLAGDGRRAVFFKTDVADANQVNKLVKFSVQKFGRLDIMVNNAGIGGSGGVLEATDADWQKTININLSGVFYGMRAAGQYMKRKKVKGAIINMSSILGSIGFPGAIAYGASKGGIVQLTHCGALDLAPLGIRVNAIAPGFIKTNMTKDYLANKEFKKMVEENTPLGYVGEPKNIADAAVFLASEESGYVTGHVIFVDGGWRAR